MNELEGRTAVIVGGTDGIGAATAIELRHRGADVVIIGRSRAKADALVERAASIPGRGSLRAIVADLGTMRAVEHVARTLDLERIDHLLLAVGILITRTEHTDEDIEKDFAVSYLGRFVLLEGLAERGLLTGTRVINIAASGRTVPRFARLEFADLAAVEARVGMTSHGQAQLANDLLTAQMPGRYDVTAIGYGPGSVDTSIRREIPRVIRAIMKPFFARSTRSASEVATQLADLFASTSVATGSVSFADKDGLFPMPDFIADRQRQADLLAASEALHRKALAAASPAT